MSQKVRAFIKDTTAKTFTLEEFKQNQIVQLTDSSYHIKSFHVYFACQENYQMRNGKICDVGHVPMFDNSLKSQNFLDMLKLFDHHFYIVLDYIIIVDKNGKDEFAISPGRIDIL